MLVAVVDAMIKKVRSIFFVCCQEKIIKKVLYFID